MKVFLCHWSCCCMCQVFNKQTTVFKIYSADTSTVSGTTGENETSSLMSDAPLTSAENVALNLLKHFNEQRLPRASELEWLVSEQDVPQKVSSVLLTLTLVKTSTYSDGQCQ